MPREYVESLGAVVEYPDTMPREEFLGRTRVATEALKQGREDILRAPGVEVTPAEPIMFRGLQVGERAQRHKAIEQINDLPMRAGEFTSHPMIRLMKPDINRPSELVSLIETNMPDTEAKVVQGPKGAPTVVARRKGETSFAEVDVPWKTTPADFLDALGFLAAPPQAGAMLGAAPFMGMGPVRGLPILGRAIPMALRGIGAATGYGAGRQVESEYQRILGAEEQTREEVLKETMMEVPLILAGSGIGEVPGAFGRFLSRASPRQEQLARILEINQFFKKEFGEPLLVAGDINPAYQTLLLMAERSSPSVQAARKDQFARALRFVKEFTEKIGAPEDLPRGELRSAVAGMRDRLLREAGSPMVSKGTKAGAEIAEDMMTWRRWVRKAEGEAWTGTRKLSQAEDIRFSLGQARGDSPKAVHQVVDEALEGNWTVTVKGGVPDLERTREIPDAVRDHLQFLRRMPEAVRSVDITVRGEKVLTTSLRQMQDTLETTRELARRSKGDLGAKMWELAEAQSEALKNPLNGSRAFTEGLRKSIALTEMRNEVENAVFTRGWLKLIRGDPDEVARTMLNPNKPRMMKQLRKMYQNTPELKGKWEHVQAEYAARVYQNPSTIKATLRAAEKHGTKDTLLRKIDADALDHYAGVWADIEKRIGKLNVLAEGARRDATQVMNAIDLNDTVMLDELLKGVGGKNSETGKALRAGIFAKIVDASEVEEVGIRVMNPKQAKKAAEELLKKPGIEKVLTEGDMEMLRNLDTAMSFMRASAIGEGIQTAAVVSQAARLPFTEKGRASIWAGFSTMFRNWVMGMTLIDSSAQKILMSPMLRGKKAPAGNVVRALLRWSPPISAIFTAGMRTADARLLKEGEPEVLKSPAIGIESPPSLLLESP